jgi:hypothetical protein
MPQVSFRCAISRGVEIDRQVAVMGNLVQARDYAMALARSRMAAAPQQDWRKHCLHVEDERGEEIFVLPFWSVLDKPGLTTRLKAAFTRTLS